MEELPKEHLVKELLPDLPKTERKGLLTVRFRCVKCGAHDSTAWHGNEPGLKLRQQMVLGACRKCGGRSMEFYHGIYGVITDDKSALTMVTTQSDANIAQTGLWKRFCAMLDAIRVPMADGHRTDRYCILCFESHVDGQCGCQCHSAWEYRKAVDAQVAPTTAAA